MNLEMWASFVLASIVILIIPGPTIILVISQAVNHGRRSVIPLAAGVVLGDFTAMTFSLLGLGALLSTSAALFSIFKWAGAVYLVYLGVKLWNSKPETDRVEDDPGKKSARSLFNSSFIVTALNPKSIAFFVAFLPQFIDPSRPVVSQSAALGGTFLILAAANAALYGLFAGQAGEYLKKMKIRKWFNRCGGCALIGAGVLTVGMRRSI